MMDLGSVMFEGVLGRGGMATVHAARLPGGLRVAVKIGERMTERGRARFLSEARALATVDHPRVVGALGLGTCRGEHSFAPDGAPFLVMDRGTGTLDPAAITRWDELQRLLEDILRGLAELHGHGFVHRDVKPANLLRFPDGYRLADLGIVADASAIRREIVGTPMCMAPEQILGDGRSFGPHTDLYGLGAAAWRVVSGSWPYFDLRPVPQAPLEEALPELVPRFAVPTDFEAWLRILLRRNPYARYRSAAHALAALRRLEGEWLPPAPTSPDGERASTVAATLDLQTLEVQSLPVENDIPPRPLWELPDTPPHSVPAVLPERSELWSLRPLPFVGRAEERRRLWEMGHRLVTRGASGVALISGLAGTGKSRLAAWIGRHLHSLGGVRTVRVPAGDGPRGTTLRDVLDSGFQAHGMNTDTARRRVAQMSLADPPADAIEVDELLRLLGLFEGPGALDGPSRDRLLARVIRRNGRIALILDDVTADAPVLTTLLELLERNPTLPLLILMTSRDPTVLDGYPGLVHVPLGPLEAGDFDQLASLMGCTPEFTNEVIRFDDLRPIVAAQKFAAREEPPPSNRALRLASMMGRTWSLSQWRSAAERAGIPDADVESVLESGAVVLRGADLAELSIPLSPGSDGSDTDLHAALVEVLDPNVSPIAFAMHCIASDQVGRAVQPLRTALNRARAGGDIARVRTLSQMLLDVMTRTDVSRVERAELHLTITEANATLPSPAARLQLAEQTVEACAGLDPDLRFRGYVSLTTGAVPYAECRELLAETAREDPELAPSIWARLAVLALLEGEKTTARADLDRIDPDALVPSAVDHYWRARAELAWQDGDLDAADAAAKRSAEAARIPALAPAHVIRGWVALEREDVDAAQHIFEDVCRAAGRVGLALSAHDALLGLAAVFEQRGELSRAIDLNTEVARIYETRRSVWAAAPMANVAMLLLRIDRREEAALAVDSVGRIADDAGSSAWQMVTSFLRLAVLDADADWEGALQRAVELRGKTQFWDPDLDRALEHARKRCPEPLLGVLEQLSAPPGESREVHA